MKYVGVDLHRDFFVAVGQDSKGTELFKKRYNNSIESVNELISLFSEPPKVVVEATRNWMWFIAALRERGCQVQLAHPFRTKAIASARIKTDSIDAKTLCDLLRADLIPQSYITTTQELDDRELSRGRINLVHDQTVLKNRIMAILGKDNLRFQGSDLFGVSGKVWLTEQILSDAKRQVIDVYLNRLSNAQEAIKLIDELIKQRSSSIPEVKLLQTIPGFGTTTAFLLASEIGTIKRFPNAKNFTSYFGLVPRLSQSGNHAYYGRITKLGKPKGVQGLFGLYRPIYQKKEYVPVKRTTFFQRRKDTMTNALLFCISLPFVWGKSTRGLWRLFYGSEAERKAGSFKIVFYKKGWAGKP
jgi:transposase